MCDEEVRNKIHFEMKVEVGLPKDACVCSLCNEDDTDKKDKDDVTEFFTMIFTWNVGVASATSL